jgi:hypothetical protein
MQDLGHAEKIVVTKDDTTIVGGKGDSPQIKGRIDQIRVEIDKSTSDYDREKLQERLAKLSGGVAIIRVGAATETELKEKKHRVEDALSATRGGRRRDRAGRRRGLDQRESGADGLTPDLMTLRSASTSPQVSGSSDA